MIGPAFLIFPRSFWQKVPGEVFFARGSPKPPSQFAVARCLCPRDSTLSP